MTEYQKKKITWLEYRAQVTGKTVEEIRQEMKDRSKLANRKNSGFASLSAKKRSEVAKKGYNAGLGRKDETSN